MAVSAARTRPGRGEGSSWLARSNVVAWKDALRLIGVGAAEGGSAGEKEQAPSALRTLLFSRGVTEQTNGSLGSALWTLLSSRGVARTLVRFGL